MIIIIMIVIAVLVVNNNIIENNNKNTNKMPGRLGTSGSPSLSHVFTTITCTLLQIITTTSIQ